MNRLLLRTFALCAALLCASSAALADLKVKTKTTMGGQTFEGTKLVKGSRQRTETNMGIRTVTIEQCDLRRTVQVNDAARTYFVTPFDDGSADAAPAAAGAPRAAASPGATRRGGTVTFNVSSVDTGERKQMLGVTARHVKTTMSSESSPDACNKQDFKMEIDGWYIDLPEFSCPETARPPVGRGPGSRPDCMDRMSFRTTGTGKRGFPLLEVVKMYGEGGSVAMTTETEVVEMSKATLDAALFDVPAGYTQARSMQDLYAGSMAEMMRNARQGNDDDDDTDADGTGGATPPGVEAAGGGESASAVPTDLGPKRPGVVRVGIVMPRAQMLEGVPSLDAAEAVRQGLAGLIKGPTVEVVAILALPGAPALQEAQQKSCDFVLVTRIKQKKGGGMFGGLGGIAGAAAAATIGGGGGRESSGAGGSSPLSASIKAKDEVSLDYELQPVGGGKPAAKGTAKAKAQSDGEDIITTVIRQAGAAVSAAAAGR